MTARSLLCVATLIFASCATGTGDAIRDRASILPLADHHQHLLGPTALPPPEVLLPAVEVPPELRRLLDARAALYANAKSGEDLANVFTADATILSWSRPSKWVRGEAELLRVVNGVVAQPYRFTPNAYTLGASHGSVNGIVEVGTADGHQYALDFLLALQKGADGLWRIAAESTTIRHAPPFHRRPILAEKVVGELDAAGIRRAIVLSVAYWLGTRFDDAQELTAEYDAVRAENDWA
ncbi:MAG TPA: hypothetical protein VHL59_20135, partial [Thermoanaerobaculia bacterium]|nr:hypothetical protein [Thermoanaerobaculia bacterium]